MTESPHAGGTGKSDPLGASGAGELVILTAGGTFDKIYNVHGELEIGKPAARNILAIAGVQHCRVIEVLALDSADMTDGDREALVRAIHTVSETAVVIVHGTDTMAETARHLYLRGVGARTVVLTGAMQPAAMTHSDAAFNLGGAVLVAQTLSPGVFIAMHGRVLLPETAFKDRLRGRFDVRGHSPTPPGRRPAPPSPLEPG